MSRGSGTNSSSICRLGPTLRAQQVRDNNTHNEVMNIMKTPSRNSPGLPAHSLVTKRWMLGHLTWLALVLSQLILTTACAASEVTAWGWNDYGQTDVPSGLTNVVAIAGGAEHSLALTAEGRVVAWGAGTTNSAHRPTTASPRCLAG